VLLPGHVVGASYDDLDVSISILFAVLRLRRRASTAGPGFSSAAAG
jgi:hypothetical protein